MYQGKKMSEAEKKELDKGYAENYFECHPESLCRMHHNCQAWAFCHNYPIWKVAQDAQLKFQVLVGCDILHHADWKDVDEEQKLWDFSKTYRLK
jgi:hypothetical protein